MYLQEELRNHCKCISLSYTHGHCIPPPPLSNSFFKGGVGGWDTKVKTTYAVNLWLLFCGSLHFIGHHWHNLVLLVDKQHQWVTLLPPTNTITESQTTPLRHETWWTHSWQRTLHSHKLHHWDMMDTQLTHNTTQSQITPLRHDGHTADT